VRVDHRPVGEVRALQAGKADMDTNGDKFGAGMHAGRADA
jgi:hypothetical protein